MPDTLYLDLEYLARRFDEEGLDVQIRRDYVGRGMRGLSCIGLVYEDFPSMLVAISIIGSQRRGLDIVKGAQTDRMGQGWIVYFPGVEAER